MATIEEKLICVTCPKGCTLIVTREGKTVLRQITAPEGLTSYEIVGVLRAAPALTGDISVLPSEGSLWPETYN